MTFLHRTRLARILVNINKDNLKKWFTVITLLKSKNDGTYYMCNHHLGDTVLFCSFARSAGISKSSKIIFLVPEKYKEIQEIFGLNSMIVNELPKPNSHWDSIMFVFLSLFNLFSKRRLIQQFPGDIILFKGGKSKVFQDMYERQRLMFGLSNDTFPSNVCIDQFSVPEQIVNEFLSYGLQIGRTVLLSPAGYSKKI